RSDGPLPRRRIGRGQARPVPPTHPTTDVRAPRPNRRSPLPGTAHPAHPIPAAQQSSKVSSGSRFRRRVPHRRRTVLGLLPTTHRCLRPPRPSPRQDHDDRDHRRTTNRRPHRAGGTGPTRPHPAPAPPRRAGLLRPPRLQRTHRSHQRTPRSPAQKRPRIPKPHPLSTALTTALRQPGPPDQCTLIPEEPVFGTVAVISAVCALARF